MELATLLLVAVVTMRPDVINHFGFEQLKVSQSVDETFDGTSVVPDTRAWWLTRKNWTDDDKFVAVLLAGGCILATIMLIFGAIKGRPGHMVPFMGLQVFDFCITSLTVISYFSYVPDVKRWIDAQTGFPLKDKLMSLEADWLMLAIVLASVTILVIKAYLIGIVWSCYKYLCQQQRSLRSAYAGEVFGHNEDAEILLPPKYEDVAQLTYNENQAPPPPYSN
jgi:lysosomal-associated transmembrane protein